MDNLILAVALVALSFFAFRHRPRELTKEDLKIAQWLKKSLDDDVVSDTFKRDAEAWLRQFGGEL